MLATQLPPSAHWALQPPQLSSSLVVSTQAPLQFVSPAPQVTVQTPREQTGAVGGQTLPQAPQLKGSLWLAVQTPPLQRIPLLGQPQTPPFGQSPSVRH